MANNTARRRTVKPPDEKNEKSSKPAAAKKTARAQRNVAHDLIGICLMVAGLLSLLAVFTDSIGVVGQYISGVLFGMTGIFAYIMPLLIIAVGFLILIAWKNNLSFGKQASIGLLILSAVTLAHIATGRTIPTDGGYLKHALDAYAYGSLESIGGGMLGGFITWPLLYLFGVTGATIVMSAAALCAIIVLTRLSLVDFGKSAAVHVADATRAVRERIPQREEPVPARRKELYNEILEDTAHAKKRKEPVLPVLDAEGVKRAPSDEPELPAFDEDKPYPFPGLRSGIKSRRGAPSLPDEETEEQRGDQLDRIVPFPLRRAQARPFEAVEADMLSDEIAENDTPPWISPEETGMQDRPHIMHEMEEPLDMEPLDLGPLLPPEEPPLMPEPEGEYQLPPVNLLLPAPERKSARNPQEEMEGNARVLEETFASFGISVKVINVARGPAITRYEMQPAPGVKISRITSLADDIAMNLAAAGVRIEAPIPGKAAIGIEVPNADVSIVALREMLESDEFKNAASRLTVALGKDIAGKVIIADIARMPHMLIAGQTGAGKSACINSLISSMLFKATPDELKLILIDPKMVELNMYNGIPHLLIPVVTDPKKAAGALGWAVQEMTERYKRFADTGSREIKGYNQKMQDAGEPTLPQIVVIIDELADLMMVAPGEVEDRICRLAQLARAAGIHLVIATQRPSVNVITGVIKANIPSRIAFAVASQVDSRTILDMAGAEKLLGRGDMLFYPSGASKPLRVQGAYVTEGEVERLVEFVRRGSDTPEYDPDLMEHMDKQEEGGEEAAQEPDDADELLPQAILMALDAGQVSVSMLQRRFRIGYSRAGRLIDAMEQRGIVSGFEGSKPRNVLISREEFQRVYGESL